jgi:phenylalanyl-tRNA synthetase beta chain
MEFSLSWLADYVDLPLRLEADASGRHRFAAADGRGREEAREKGFHIGKRLTAVGLAVEGLAVHPLAASTAIAGQAPGEGAFDLVLDIDVTSNRPDCMCHFGVARELAVALDQPLRRPSTPIYGSFSTDGATGAVALEDPEGCPRYVARVIRGVKIGPSPDWLRARLESIGQRSINNVVDVTNFVLWETGQPLHAFDLSTLPGGEIRVRRALPGERLTTLDGKARDLDPEVLVIADRTRAVALAGVMGGLDTEVTGSTVDLLLESAHFDRRRVRVGAKRLGLHTDASHRFERGTDPLLCDEASCRAAALIVEVAGGRVEEPAVDAVAVPHVPVGWRLDGAALDRFVGAEIPAADIERILAALGFAPRRIGARGFEGTVPSFRAVDFEPRRGPAGGAYPQDLYEEVLRHWGFDRVAATLPGLAGVDPGASPGWDRRARVQGCFAALGFAEGIHFAFHDRAADERLPALVAGPAPALANPLSDRYAVMRRSLVPNLAAAAEFNLDRDATAVRLFEVGHLFPGAGGDEIEAVAAAIAGVSGTPWDRHPAADLAELKGAFEALLAELGAEAETRAAELAGVVSGTGAEWLADGRVVGWLGQIEATAARLPLFAGELLLDLLPLGSGRERVRAPSRVPGIAADLTLTHAVAVEWVALCQAIQEEPDPLRVGFRLKDRYQGPGVPEGAVATTITFDYHAGDRTLAQDEVNERQASLAARLERRFGVARGEGA